MEHAADLLRGREGGQAAAGIATVPLDVRGNHRFQCIAKDRRQIALFDQDLAEGPGLLRCALRHGGDELVTVDQIHLHRQDPEKDIALEA